MTHASGSGIKCPLCLSGAMVSNLEFTQMYCASCNYEYATIIDGLHGIKFLWGSRKKEAKPVLPK